MSLPKLAVSRPVFIFSLVLLMLFTGTVGLLRLPVSLFPETEVPFVSVTTLYPGAGPKEVEIAISKPLEDELSTLEGVKKINAVSQDSLSLFWIEFKSGINLDSAEQRVRDKVALARAKFPRDAEASLIERFNPSNQPVVTAFVQSKTSNDVDLTTWIDQDLKPLLSRVPRVGRIVVIGGQKRQVDVLVDSDKIEKYRIPLMHVVEALRNGGANVPAGGLTLGDQELGVRTLGQYSSLKAVEEKIVFFGNGETPIRVKDIGAVKEGVEKVRSQAYYQGNRGVIIQIYKQSGANTVQVSDSVKDSLSDIAKASKARGYHISIVRDGAKTIRDNVFDVWESILIGILLTIVVVYFFLGSFRSTLITGFAIPNSLIGAFVLMSAAGFSINILTLLALSLCVGLLVDDAIVVRENIFKKIESGMEPKEAAVVGANEVAMAVVAVTAAILSMFGPVGFLKGVTGQFFREFGLVVCFAMIISLFDALAVAPMLSAYWGGGRIDKQGKRNLLQRAVAQFDRFQSWLEYKYLNLLEKTLRYPIATLVGVLVIAVLLGSAVTSLPSGFLPTDQSSEFSVRVQLPNGSSLESTRKAAAHVDEYLRGSPFVAYTFVTVGNSFQEIHKAEINVQLKSSSERRGRKPSEIRTLVQQELTKLPGVPAGSEVFVLQNDISGSGQRPFNLLIQTQDLAELDELARKVFRDVAQIPGLMSPELELRTGATELQLVLSDRESQRLGLNPVIAGLDVRTRVEGVEVGKLRVNGLETPVKVRTPDPEATLLQAGQPLLVPNVNMTPVDLRKAATFQRVQAPAKIERVNRAYSARITADMTEGASLGEIMTAAEKAVRERSKNMNGVSVLFEGDAESYTEMSESMSLAFLFGIVLLFLVLASLYESFLLSFLNIITLPLAVSGAFSSLWLFGEGLNIYSVIGILLLLGVATKNSILLIETAQEQQHKNVTGEGLMVSLKRATVLRLRPILMTSLALVAGCIPIAIGLNEASATRTGMGVAIIGGTLTSTLFTLVFVPALLVLVAKFTPTH
jgi:HAE1 family hydrophobic/amphiphilic exporter-1